MAALIKAFPQLYGVATNGKIKTVKYWVEELEDGTSDICNEHGYIDGRQQIDRRNIKVGKNIGKANETTVQDQAISEAESKWKKKLDSNYTENESGKPSESERSLLPMLAHSFDKRKHNIVYPCLVQPKLDGVRCMLSHYPDYAYRFSSRKDKDYTTVNHLLMDLLKAFAASSPAIHIDVSKTPLDGEIYKHGMSLQEINRRVKKYREGETEELEYWVYDIADTNKENMYRDALLTAFRVNLGDDADKIKIKFLDSRICKSEKEVMEAHDEFVKAGFEGAIVRNYKGKYVFDKRSADLQKVKEFQDDEFEIVGATSGEGREGGAIIWKCKVKDPVNGGADTFEVRPRGSIDSRIDLMNRYNANPRNFNGKKLTVRYFALTEDNLPQFPVGIGIRLKEDLP